MNRAFRAAIVAACLFTTPVLASENDGTTGKSFSAPITLNTYWQAIACKVFGYCQTKPVIAKSENDGTTNKSENDGTTGD